MIENKEKHKLQDWNFENFQTENLDRELGLEVRKSSMVLENNIETFISKASFNEVNFYNFNEL